MSDNKSTAIEERKAFDEWIHKRSSELLLAYLAEAYTEEDMEKLLSSEDEKIHTDCVKSFWGKKCDSRIKAMLNIYFLMINACESMPFCGDIKYVINLAEKGWEFFEPEGSCSACSREAKGQRNKEVFYELFSIPFHGINDINNNWFLLDSDSIFQRPVAVLLSFFACSSLMSRLKRYISPNCRKVDREVVGGVIDAIKEMSLYFKANRPAPASPGEMAAAFEEDMSPYGELWENICTSEGDEILLGNIPGHNWATIPEEYESLADIEAEDVLNRINFLIGKEIRTTGINKDERNGYCYFLSLLRKWIQEEGKDGGLAGYAIICLLAYFHGGLARLTGENFEIYNPDEDEDNKETDYCYLDMLDNIIKVRSSEGGENLPKRMFVTEDLRLSTVMDIIYPDMPRCMIINPQFSNSTSLLVYMDAFFGMKQMPVLAERCGRIPNIDNIDLRAEGIQEAIKDVLEGYGKFTPSYINIEDEGFLEMIGRFLEICYDSRQGN